LTRWVHLVLYRLILLLGSMNFQVLTYLIPAFSGKNGSDDIWVLRPDEVTFIGILCACTRLGLLDAGKVYFEQLSTMYSPRPTTRSLTCPAAKAPPPCPQGTILCLRTAPLNSYVPLALSALCFSRHVPCTSVEQKILTGGHLSKFPWNTAYYAVINYGLLI
jgi:hypothetical protein